MNYLEDYVIETIYEDDYTDYTRVSDYEIFIKDILLSINKLNIKETKRKYEEKFVFPKNGQKIHMELAPLALITKVEDSSNFLKRVLKTEYTIKLNYVYYPFNKCQKIIPFKINEYTYNKNATVFNSFFCLHGNLECSNISLFPARTFPIQRFFFVNEFIELEIYQKNYLEADQSLDLESVSISNLILNSIQLALNELNFSVPTFVVIDKTTHIYQGFFYISNYWYYKYDDSKYCKHNEKALLGETECGNIIMRGKKYLNGKKKKKEPKTTPYKNEIKRYVINHRGTGFEMNYSSFQFRSYFKYFSFDYLLSLFCLFIYLSNLKGEDIFRIKVYLKRIYLFDTFPPYNFGKAVCLKNKKYRFLQWESTKEADQRKEKLKKNWKCLDMITTCNKLVIDSVKQSNEYIMKEEEETLLEEDSDDSEYFGLYETFDSEHTSTSITEVSFKDSKTEKLIIPSTSENVSQTKKRKRKKSIFQEINTLFSMLHKTYKSGLSKYSHFFLSIYILNFVKNVHYSILKNLNESEQKETQTHKEHNKIKKEKSQWKIRFINNDKYKGKHSALLKNILKMFYEELSNWKKNNTNDISLSSNLMNLEIEEYDHIKKYISMQKFKWLKDYEPPTFNCFNIEDEMGRYYIDTILNLMFNNNEETEQQVYEYWENRKKKEQMKNIRIKQYKQRKLFCLNKKKRIIHNSKNHLIDTLSKKNIHEEIDIQTGWSLNEKDKKLNHYSRDINIRRNLSKLKKEEEQRPAFLFKSYLVNRMKLLYRKRQNTKRSKNKRKEKNKNIKKLIRNFQIINNKYFLCYREEKICILLCYLISHSSNKKTFFYIWNQFYELLRNKYENNEYITSNSLVLSYGPLNLYNYKCSLISQYVKSLNVAIQQNKMILERNQNQDTNKNKNKDGNQYQYQYVNEKRCNDLINSLDASKINMLRTNYKPFKRNIRRRYTSFCKEELNTCAQLKTKGRMHGSTGDLTIQTKKKNSKVLFSYKFQTNNNVYIEKEDSIKKDNQSQSQDKETEIVKLSSFFPYPLSTMDLFISKNSISTNKVNEQDDIIMLMYEFLESNDIKKMEKDCSFNQFFQWYKKNIRKIYSTQKVLKLCYESIKCSFFVNINKQYIKEKYKEIEKKYYSNKNYFQNMFHFVKQNEEQVKKIKTPFNPVLVGELILDHIGNMNFLEILEYVYRIFFISYINSVMHSKVIYVDSLQKVLSDIFQILKKIHKKKFHIRKKNTSSKYVIQKHRGRVVSFKKNERTKGEHKSSNSKSLDTCKWNQEETQTSQNEESNNNQKNNQTLHEVMVMDIPFYDDGDDVNETKQDPTKKDSNCFIKNTQRNFKIKCAIIFNKKLFELFEKLEELFDKSVWLYELFTYSKGKEFLNESEERNIIKLINLVIESNEHEILINSKREPYFLNFVNNLHMYHRKQEYDLYIQESEILSTKTIQHSFTNNNNNNNNNYFEKRKEEQGKGQRNDVLNYSNLGLSVKVKDRKSQNYQNPCNNMNIINEDRFSNFFRSQNIQQNVQECIIDYVNDSFDNLNSDQCTFPYRMSCSANHLISTVSFLKISPIL